MSHVSSFDHPSVFISLDFFSVMIHCNSKEVSMRAKQCLCFINNRI